jgi:hypothetical protein
MTVVVSEHSLHEIVVLLSLLYDLGCLLPLLLEYALGLFDFLFLFGDPSLELFALDVISPGRHLVGLEHLLK